MVFVYIFGYLMAGWLLGCILQQFDSLDVSDIALGLILVFWPFFVAVIAVTAVIALVAKVGELIGKALAKLVSKNDT